MINIRNKSGKNIVKRSDFIIFYLFESSNKDFERGFYCEVENGNYYLEQTMTLDKISVWKLNRLWASKLYSWLINITNNSGRNHNQKFFS